MPCADAAPANGGRALSAANLLTASRLLLTVPIVVFMYTRGPAAAWTAFGLFVAAMLTDVFDGRLARRDPGRSPLGNYLDPVADKVLLMSIFICLAHGGVVPVWMVLVLVGREFVVNGVRSAGAVRGVVVGANWMGKTKTFLQTLAVSAALLGRALAAAGKPDWRMVDRFLAAAWWLTLAATVSAALFCGVFVWWNRNLFRPQAS